MRCFLAAFCVFSTILLHLLSATTASVTRPRGVDLRNIGFYDPAKPFVCLDSKKKIDFSQVNDDYCDCEDGTDEPGTAACAVGKFFCEDSGYVSKLIPSSRVNDAICDCCDGSDEYASSTKCPNDCMERGRQMREERERMRKLVQEGQGMRQKMAEEGQVLKRDKQARLEQLEKERAELELKDEELQRRKEEAERPEKEAKEKHEKTWKDVKERLRQEKEQGEAKELFTSIDTNQNLHLEAHELAVRTEYEKLANNDGEFSEEEAKEILGEAYVTFQGFLDTVWPKLRDTFRDHAAAPADSNADSDSQEEKKSGDLDEHEESESHDDDDDDDEDDQDDVRTHAKDEDDLPMPEYDEDTKHLIEVANKAREEYEEVSQQLKKIDNELSTIRKHMDLDLGTEREFAPLQGRCFEYTDREYIYSLCPFDRVSQRQKSGGGDTSLGTWSRWVAVGTNQHGAMMFEHGLRCWNGPDRSVKVHISCGTEDRVTAVSEVQRCEYEYQFESPAACHPDHLHSHRIADEL